LLRRSGLSVALRFLLGVPQKPNRAGFPAPATLLVAYGFLTAQSTSHDDFSDQCCGSPICLCRPSPCCCFVLRTPLLRSCGRCDGECSSSPGIVNLRSRDKITRVQVCGSGHGHGPPDFEGSRSSFDWGVSQAPGRIRSAVSETATPSTVRSSFRSIRPQKTLGFLRARVDTGRDLSNNSELV